MNAPTSITITPIRVADLQVEGEITHLHADHCGGNHLFAGEPIHVQRRELDDAHSQEDYIREWVDAPGVQYVAVDGELELLHGLRLVPAPATQPACRWSSWRLAGARSRLALRRRFRR